MKAFYTLPSPPVASDCTCLTIKPYPLPHPIVKLLGESLRARISAFDRDVDATCLRLEPMDKDERYVVHDVVADFPELVSVGVRFVLLDEIQYRESHN